MEEKGIVNNYNKIPTIMRDNYYDRDITDKDIRQQFIDSTSKLVVLNKKLKKELEKEKPTKIKIEKEEE